MFPCLIRFACWIAVALVLPSRAEAQKSRNLSPSGVTVQSAGAGVAIDWLPIPVRGVTYRVLRAPDPASAGVDLIAPSSKNGAVDPNPAPGVTYFYQVVAVFTDGSQQAAAPVQFTVPGAMVKSVSTISSRGRSSAVAAAAAAAPTVLSGISVNGTMAAATVTWPPVQAVASYTVTRSHPNDATSHTSPSLTTTTWTDTGIRGVGLENAGVYTYQVTATRTDGSVVTGSTTWTRPDPTCPAPAPNQPLLVALDPAVGSMAGFVATGPFPSGPMFNWNRNAGSGVVGYRVDRSVSGSSIWAPLATTCTVPSAFHFTPAPSMVQFVDTIPNIVPNTTYLYRLTAYATTGDIGSHIVPWLAPNTATLQWLPGTISGTSVTVKWRYNPPATNAPASPIWFQLQWPGGSQRLQRGCSALAGCAYTASVASGAQAFRVVAGWGRTTHYGSSLGPTISAVAADTVITVP